MNLNRILITILFWAKSFRNEQQAILKKRGEGEGRIWWDIKRRGRRIFYIINKGFF